MNFAHRARSTLNTGRMVFFVFALGVGILLIFVISFRLISGQSAAQTLNYSELLQQLDNGNVRSATIVTSKSGVEISGVLKLQEKSFTVPLESGDVENLRKRLAQAGVPTSSAEKLERGSLRTYEVIGETVAVFVIFFAVVIWGLKKAILESKRLRSLEGK
jgi:ATP-dependent Zn protease